MAADFNTPMQLKNALWDFALTFYQLPHVEATCLSLQDRYGMSVNRLLLACWASHEGLELEANDFEGEAYTWQQEVTHEVRKARYQVRQNKVRFEACYQKLRQAELACEQVELVLLFEAVSGRDSAAYSEALLKQNLDMYLNTLQIPKDNVLENELDQLKNALRDYKGMKPAE